VGSLTNQSATIGSGILSQIAVYRGFSQQNKSLESFAQNNSLPEENNQLYEQIADLNQRII